MSQVIVIVMDMLAVLSVGFINSHTWNLTGQGWKSLCETLGRPESLTLTEMAAERSLRGRTLGSGNFYCGCLP